MWLAAESYASQASNLAELIFENEGVLRGISDILVSEIPV
jgi:hypothetical protein